MIKSARISFVILGILLASQVFAENSKVKQIVDAKYYDTLVKNFNRHIYLKNQIE